MTRRRIPAFVAFALTFAAGPALTQGQHSHDHGAGSRVLGQMNFPIACNAAAQEAFNRGMLMQHSFWYEAASEAFRAARQGDPGCTMTHWGEALSLLTNPYSPPTAANLRQARILVEEARRLGARNEREGAYVEALSELYAGDDLAGHRARLARYRDAMARFHQRFPDDTEGAIQYALVLGVAAVPTDKTYADQLRGTEILEREWQRQPNHPGIVHYLIHLYDYPPLAERGIRAAERYADLAADAPHALHMPSHIFTRVGRWEASIATNLRAAERAVVVNDTEQEFHASDYMVYAYLQTAQDAAARRAIDIVGRSNSERRQATAFASAAMPARYALERGAWAEATTLTPRQSNFLFTDALIHFARAIGFARSGRAAEASADIDALKRIVEALRTRDAYWSEQVDIQRQTAEGWIAFAAGRREEGLATLRQAAEREGETEKHVVTPGPLAPARELLAEALLEAGQHAAARQEFEAVQRTEPRRFRAAFGAARAAELAGDREAAQRLYGQVLEIAARSDTPRPELVAARAYLGRN